MNPVETLLRSEIGFEASSIGASAVERAVRLRMKSLGLEKPEDYHALLESSAAEREELFETVVVTETWFFREKESFEAFSQLVQKWLLENSAEELRILSVPCSSGEEPYSLAMCLLDLGLTSPRFIIDAVDISARTLERATSAEYGKNSFRGGDMTFRDRYFRKTKDGYILNKSVRECVRFQQDNVLSGMFLAGREPYHFIFCRNLLIYFDTATQGRAREALRGKLRGGGALFVGPAELPIYLDNGFVPANLPMSFACLKGIGESPQSKGTLTTKPFSPSRSSDSLPPNGAAKSKQTAPSTGGSEITKKATAAGNADKNDAGLEYARKLADAGKLTEAEEACQDHIRQYGPSADGCHLLGLVYDAVGDPRAEEFYRRALYLMPDHVETLWHMALLMKKNGNESEARVFKRRAERARLRGRSPTSGANSTDASEEEQSGVPPNSGAAKARKRS
jgi:chemotaxis protein methyltransferase WspC